MSLNIHINIDEITEEFEGLEERMKMALQEGVKLLAIQTEAHVREQANKELHSRRAMFLEHLKMVEEHDGVWSIVVPEKIMWIEEGMEPHSMIPDLLKSPKAKTAKDGSRYVVVPFQHNKGPTEQPNEFASSVTEMLKNNLKKMKVPYQKIEKNPDGSPKLGRGGTTKTDGTQIVDQKKLHSIDMGGPKRPHWTSPVLDGVTIYQNRKKNPDGSFKGNKQTGKPTVFRDIMTFRVASSKHQGQKWDHPGLEGKEFLDEAYQWALNHWEHELLPTIIAKVVG